MYWVPGTSSGIRTNQVPYFLNAKWSGGVATDGRAWALTVISSMALSEPTVKTGISALKSTKQIDLYFLMTN